MKQAVKTFEALSKAVQKGLVASLHDCSEGGMAVALSEMAFSGGFGAEVFLAEVPYVGKQRRNDFILFSETNSRFIAEVSQDKQKDFEKTFKGISYGLIGCTQAQKKLRVHGLEGKICLEADVNSLKEAWQKPLKW